MSSTVPIPSIIFMLADREDWYLPNEVLSIITEYLEYEKYKACLIKWRRDHINDNKLVMKELYHAVLNYEEGKPSYLDDPNEYVAALFETRDCMTSHVRCSVIGVYAYICRKKKLKAREEGKSDDYHRWKTEFKKADARSQLTKMTRPGYRSPIHPSVSKIDLPLD